MHGVSIFIDYDECATFSATVNVHNDDDSLLTSQTGLFDLVTQDNVDATHRDVDVIFDNALALRKNIQYCIQVSIDDSDACFIHGPLGSCHVQCGGVTFTFDDVPTLVAEYLFKVDD